MGRLLGVDYGRRRIGIALSDPTGVIASPGGCLEVGSFDDALKLVAEACEEKGADAVVVGIPYNMDGSEGEMAAEASRFADGLARLGLRVRKWDERLSTTQAMRALGGSGMSGRKKKGKADSVAAQIILQSFLDSSPNRPQA